MPRTIAIGDIHGCSTALNHILVQIDPQPDDTIVTLGDYVDRGFDSKGVLDILISLSNSCHLVPILGNHDEMMLRSSASHTTFRNWLEMGGITALDSYGDSGQLDLVPNEHFEFLNSCLPYFETDTHVFLHANYKPDLPLTFPDENTIRWLSLRDYVPSKRHCSGKIAVVGHTPQTEILDLGYLICIDTGCAVGGKLTALDVDTGQTWEAAE